MKRTFGETVWLQNSINNSEDILPVFYTLLFRLNSGVNSSKLFLSEELV